MTPATIREKILTNQAWLERAVLALDAAQRWREDDRKNGQYLAAWCRKQLTRRQALGKCLTADVYVGNARSLVQKYCAELLQISLDKALRDAKFHAAKAKQARARVRAIRRHLDKPLGQPSLLGK